MSGLILRKDTNKEEFDIFKLRTENVSQFIAYYALLLSTACQFELISQIEAEEISKEILRSFNEKFETDSKVMANNMYVLTCYLQAMKNSEQLEMLSNNSAQDVFDNANIWFRKELDIIEKSLLEIKVQVYKLNDELIINSFKDLLWITDEYKSYSKVGTNCDFKKEHKRPVPISYQLSYRGEILEENCLKTLSKTVKMFNIEISILNKLNPSEVMKNLKSSNKRELNQIIIKNELQKKKLEKELEKAKKTLYEELERARKISMYASKKLEELEKKDREEFEKLNPDLKGDTFENAFADWQESLPEEHFDIFDENECENEFEISDKARQKYRETEFEILKKLDALDKVSDKDFSETESMQTMNMSLDSIFKIQAIIEMQKVNPDFTIPMNSEELAEMLEKIELAKAIQVVLATIKPNFLDVEIDYLKNIVG